MVTYIMKQPVRAYYVSVEKYTNLPILFT